MMKKWLTLGPLWALGIYIVLDAVWIGMGMGVPIFCILFGFPVGWYIVKNVTGSTTIIPDAFRRVLIYSAASAAVTLIGMVIIWGPTISRLFDPVSDLANFGIPMILYEPKASFIGWIVLMIIISPFLQLLTILFGSHLTLLGWLNESKRSG